MQYPSATEVELGFKGVAAELGDPSSVPFRVGMLPVNGGKPPLYSGHSGRGGRAAAPETGGKYLTAHSASA